MKEHKSEKISKKGASRDETVEKMEKGIKNKNHAVPIGSLILTFFLIAVIAAAGYFGMQYMETYTSVKNEFDHALQAAEEEKAAAEAVCAEEDPESAANVALRAQVTEEMIAEAKSEIESLQKQSEETDDAVRAAEEKIAVLQSGEGYDFYRSVYDEYLEGRAYVEELLSGD